MKMRDLYLTLPVLALAASVLQGCGYRVPEGMTLHDAAEQGDTRAIEALLDEGADVNGHDEDGWTPLHWAAGKGQMEAVQMLLERGARPNLGGAGFTPGFLAALAGHTEIVELLRQYD